MEYRSDSLSLGIIAYLLIVGSNTFGQGAATDIAQRICETPPEHAKNLMLNAPSALTDLLMEMLIQPREQRTLTASGIENRLKHIRSALLQAEMSEQETLPLNANTIPLNTAPLNTAPLNTAPLNTTQQYSYTSALPVTENAAGFSASKTALVKKHRSIASAFLLLCLSLILYFGFYNEKEPQTKQVVILKPILVDSEHMAAMQQDLVTSAVEDALRQAVINTNNMYLISQREVNAITKDYPDDLRKLQQAVGASDIISTELTCDNNSCKVNFSRLVVNTKNNDVLLVESERNWLVPIDKFNAIFNTSQTQFASLFPEQSGINQSGLVQRPIEENDYRDYLALYSDIRGNGNNTAENLAQLEVLITRTPYLYAAYSLYSRAAIDLYIDTLDSAFLDKVEFILGNSPPEYRYSIFHAIHKFGLALHRQELELAALQIQEAKNRGANDFILAERKAVLLFSKGEYQEAINAFIKSYSLRPSTTLLYNLALSYWRMDNLVEAEKILNEMLIIVPNNTKAKRLQATIWLLQGHLELAINTYEILVSKTDDVNYLTNLSLAYALNKQYEKAYESSKKALIKAPKHPENLLLLADIEKIQGKEKSASIHYQKVINILKAKNDVQSLVALAQAYGQLNKPNLAIEALSKAQVLAPDSGEVAHSSAVVYSLLKESTSAVHYVKFSLKRNVGVAWFNLPWFDELCENNDFVFLMQQYNNTKRCVF